MNNMPSLQYSAVWRNFAVLHLPFGKFKTLDRSYEADYEHLIKFAEAGDPEALEVLEWFKVFLVKQRLT